VIDNKKLWQPGLFSMQGAENMGKHGVRRLTVKYSATIDEHGGVYGKSTITPSHQKAKVVVNRTNRLDCDEASLHVFNGVPAQIKLVGLRSDMQSIAS
jgi:hypothetical protein